MNAPINITKSKIVETIPSITHLSALVFGFIKIPPKGFLYTFNILKYVDFINIFYKFDSFP